MRPCPKVGPLPRWHNVRYSCSILHCRNLACSDHCCYPLASITHARRICAACGMEFILAKPSTRISRALVRLFPLLVGRILRLFILQASVSCICSSEVPKVSKRVEKKTSTPSGGCTSSLTAALALRGTIRDVAARLGPSLHAQKDGAFLSTDGATYEAN